MATAASAGGERNTRSSVFPTTPSRLASKPHRTRWSASGAPSRRARPTPCRSKKEVFLERLSRRSSHYTHRSAEADRAAPGSTPAAPNIACVRRPGYTPRNYRLRYMVVPEHALPSDWDWFPPRTAFTSSNVRRRRSGSISARASVRCIVCNER